MNAVDPGLMSRRQFSFVQPFELPEDGKVLRLTYSEGIKMLRESGEDIDDFADMTYLPFATGTCLTLQNTTRKSSRQTHQREIPHRLLYLPSPINLTN